jgi:organic radical activating enzyme
MFGNNIIRKPLKGDGTKLQIQEIFKTFQGEGPFTGHPAIFIRLGGCNLACDFCDTEFESFQELTLEKVILTTNKLSGKQSDLFTHKLVVITGGEPFRQPIEKLCDELISQGYHIQIETNGTLFRNVNKLVSIVCSPKNTNGYTPIRDDLLQRINAFKFIISANNSLYNQVGEVGQTKYNTPIYVQPMDESDENKNLQNLQATIKIASINGYNISLQTHKIIGVR